MSRDSGKRASESDRANPGEVGNLLDRFSIYLGMLGARSKGSGFTGKARRVFGPSLQRMSIDAASFQTFPNNARNKLRPNQYRMIANGDILSLRLGHAV